MSKIIRSVQVIKRPGNKSPNWYLRYFEFDPITGKQRERWKSTRTTVRKRADALRRDLEHELSREDASSSSTKWADFKREFFEKQGVRKPATTIAFYTNCLRVFERVAKPTTIQAITPPVIEDFADARLKEGVAPATVNRDLRHLKAALRWGERRGLIEKAPDFHGLFVRVPKKSPVVIPESDFLAMVSATESSLTKLEKRSGGWWRTFLYIAYYLGLRRGELLALSWRDIDFERPELRVMAPSSKGRKERVLPLSASLANLLRDWKSRCEGAKKADPVLAWPYDSIRGLYHDWAVIQDAAGIPKDQRYVLKNLRSTCASELIAKQVATAVVKDILGHATVVTTENYYLNTEPARRAVADIRPIRLTPGAESAAGQGGKVAPAAEVSEQASEKNM
ncbi:Tyrosine recombinase XerC [Botrimarina colliarenosi]|uniref:Tyrosine recombinase XerC n=1 Tax=Botrimarina colliarenosi TaxID=2528001 RepID=A0A5C6AFJ1_9BACT|nr:site-specific integrase [Botrimarina colliarenosi]TWT98200.1 Tyrosine recombinase XerC [Botrimarina colliarenosi]